MDQLEFDVSNLVQASTGTSEQYAIETDLHLEGITAESLLKTTIEIMRMEDGFNISAEDFSLDIEVNCMRCLEPYRYTVNVGHAERQFYFEAPEDEKDQADVYTVDTKHQKVDISEMIRQEILLHYPANQVCSDRCKGICQICGKDRNKEQCDCKEQEFTPEDQKPLAKLKDLLK
ncbi:DUF177 domain-containing protein [Candidatus Peregrinibacteria bacterium]|jgi:uncharacterized protein|nr:DUF177 domain-containing protein [Candidatus Peregrinibacteria bacterium]